MLHRLLTRIARASVWSASALDDEPKKYRTLTRIWLPVYDLIAIIAGVMACLHGSTILYGIFGQGIVDIVGGVFALVAVACLICVAFPRLWKLEMWSKSALIGMVVAYISCILFLPSQTQLEAAGSPNYFVAAMLAFGLPLAMFRMNMLADEAYERRVKKRVKEIQEQPGGSND